MAESFRSPRKVIRRLRYLPSAVRQICNWPSFIFHYALGLMPAKPYRFRNGAKLAIGRAIDHVPIIEIFLQEEYGAIPDGAVVLDLGANIGAFSIYAATTARNLRVHAYEPYPAFYALLQENVRLNRQTKTIQCFNCAVAAETGTRSLQPDEEGFFFPTLMQAGESDETGRSAQVKCMSLANIIDTNRLARVDFVKMDCEGAEYEILYATPGEYLRRIGELRMEYHNLDAPEYQAARLEQFLVGHGFKVTKRRANTATNGTLWFRHEASAGTPPGS